MNTTQHRTTPRPTARRTVAVAGAAFTLAALCAVPASASPDPGPPASASTWSAGSCALERVGTQFVRCDDLTGNGVAAPAHVHER